uniref:ATP-binding domain-containing protein n=1 Tax=Pseudonocardia lacus TaxID=2835865 RepID=UPI001BDC7DE4
GGRAAAADRAALHRADGAAWTVSDVPLLDEAFELLGREPDRRPAERERARAAEVAKVAEDVRVMLDDEAFADDDEILTADLVSTDVLADRQRELDTRSTAERAAADREWIYGHVVVDEAQELSAMDWRMLVRRCPTRSFTVVGDLAQRRAAGGVRAWEQVADGALPGRWTLRRLSVDYRTPAEVAAVAADVLAEHLPGHTAPRPVRSTGTVPWARRVAPDELGAAVRAAVTDAAGPGTTAVITPVPLPDVPGATVLAPHEAKGLEFDVVVLVEPDEILAGSPSDLYVAITRATQQLGVLHTRPLPAALHRLTPRS